jgi:hypothetical protein
MFCNKYPANQYLIKIRKELRIRGALPLLPTPQYFFMEWFLGTLTTLRLLYLMNARHSGRAV